jgi:hypothetical protein
MTAPMLMTDCPTEETLAAYVDDRLDAATRLEVTEHLASCGDCRELVMMASDFRQTEAPGNVVTGTFGRRGWIAVAAGLAAAAAIIVVVLPYADPRFVQGSVRSTATYWKQIFGLLPAPDDVMVADMDDVIEAASELSRRPALGRLAGDFPYREPVRTYRGGGDESSDVQKAELYTLTAKLQEEKSPDLHRLGVATFFIAENGSGFKDAVAYLEAGHKKAQGNERDAIAIDLAAALLAYGRWNGDEKLYERAFELSDDVWARKKTPAAAWNRAVALGMSQRTAEAISAWNDYLNLDGTSEWAKEARKLQAELNADP